MLRAEYAVIAAVLTVIIGVALGISWTGGELEDFPTQCGDNNYTYGFDTSGNLLCRPDQNSGTGSTTNGMNTTDFNTYFDENFNNQFNNKDLNAQFLKQKDNNAQWTQLFNNKETDINTWIQENTISIPPITDLNAGTTVAGGIGSNGCSFIMGTDSNLELWCPKVYVYELGTARIGSIDINGHTISYPDNTWDLNRFRNIQAQNFYGSGEFLTNVAKQDTNNETAKQQKQNTT